MTKKQIKHFIDKGQPIKRYDEMKKMLDEMAEKTKKRREFEANKEK